MNDLTLLAFDSGSPIVSVAVRAGGETLSVAQAQSRSSTQLPTLADGLLAEAGRTWKDLQGVVAARGPGSFTGLRVGLGFALGLHQSLGMPATAIPTLELLAHASNLDQPVTAAVNAWRDSWFVQSFSRWRLPAAPPTRVDHDQLGDISGPLVVMSSGDAPRGAIVADTSLAAAAIELAIADDFAWDPSALSDPLYLAAAPAVLPAKPSTPAPHRT